VRSAGAGAGTGVACGLWVLRPPPGSGPAHLCGPLPGGQLCHWGPPPSPPPPPSLGAPLAVGWLPCASVLHGPQSPPQRQLCLHLGRPHAHWSCEA
jgi:hypothetical protein